MPKNAYFHVYALLTPLLTSQIFSLSKRKSWQKIFIKQNFKSQNVVIRRHDIINGAKMTIFALVNLLSPK